MTTRDVVFALIGLVAATSALLSVTTRQVVHAALWLVVCLGTLAGCYVVLGAEIVALVQVLIYVGAVVVLVLFALMLTRAPIGRQRDLSTSVLQRVAAAVLGAATTGLLLAMLVPLVGEDAVTPVSGDTRAVATAIFGTWVWPFELLSVLLLVALIGAFAVARVAGAMSPRAAGPPASDARHAPRHSNPGFGPGGPGPAGPASSPSGSIR
ncbi:MAG: NADH-quinone oxidoreductase subunit J [Lapillicoccus sp.]